MQGLRALDLDRMWRLLIGLMCFCGCKKPPEHRPVAPVRATKCMAALEDIVRISQCDQECAAGDAEACGISATRYRDGVRVRRDRGIGLARGLRGCELGSARACAVVASFYEGADPDQREIFERRARARGEVECEAGRASSCGTLSYAVLRPLGDEKPDQAKSDFAAERALMLKRTGCDRGDWYSCRQLAFANSLGIFGLAKSPDTGRDLFEKACRLGDPSACWMAIPDEASAEPYLQRGCQLGSGQTCFLWSAKLKGAARRGALQKSCDQQHAPGCVALSRDLGADGDAQGARKAQQAACELDDKESCPNE